MLASNGLVTVLNYAQNKLVVVCPVACQGLAPDRRLLVCLVLLILTYLAVDGETLLLITSTTTTTIRLQRLETLCFLPY